MYLQKVALECESFDFDMLVQCIVEAYQYPENLPVVVTIVICEIERNISICGLGQCKHDSKLSKC